MLHAFTSCTELSGWLHSHAAISRSITCAQSGFGKPNIPDMWLQAPMDSQFDLS